MEKKMKLIEEQSKQTHAINTQKNENKFIDNSEMDKNPKIKEKIIDISQENTNRDIKIKSEKIKNESNMNNENPKISNSYDNLNSILTSNTKEEEFLNNLKSMKMHENNKDIKTIQNEIFGNQPEHDYTQPRSKNKKSNKKRK